MSKRQHLMDQITDFVGTPRVPAGVGSSVHNDFIQPLVWAVGLNPSDYSNKYRCIEAVISRLGGVYDPDTDTSEGTPSGGGGTLTNRGLEKIWFLLSASGFRDPDSVSGDFPDPEAIEDARQRVRAEIVRRQGQATWRKALLEAHNFRCDISRWDVESGLEAAHIIAYRGSHSNELRNGLILRADLHHLFDLGQIAIEPGYPCSIHVAKRLRDTMVGVFHGQQVHLPGEESGGPSLKLLAYHRSQAEN